MTRMTFGTHAEEPPRIERAYIALIELDGDAEIKQGYSYLPTVELAACILTEASASRATQVKIEVAAW